MAISLGSIVVDLIAKTGGFVEGMTKASYEAQKAAKSIKGSFADMGGAAESLLAPFGEIGSAIGASFAGLGNTFASVSTALTGLAGGASAAAVAIGGLVAAGAAVGVAGAGIALMAAKNANELFEMSEKTGVSVEALSRLGFAAAQTGVSQEGLTKALERMNKSAFGAATAPEGAKNAYTRLGISVKDAAGNLKPTSELFEEVAQKIAGIENPTARGAAAMNIFGKAGADLLPLLNQGSEGIAKMAKEADELGITISTKTAADSHKFEQTLGAIQGALTGASNAVLKEFLPSLQAFASFILNDLKDPSGVFRTIGTVVLNIAVPSFKALASAIAVAVTIGDYFVTALTQGVLFATKLVYGLGNALESVTHGNFKEAGNVLKESFRQGLADFTKGVVDETGKADKRLQDFFASTWFGQDNGAQPEKKKQQPATKVDVSSGEPDFIKQRIDKLKAETAAEGKLAGAISATTANTIVATAAAEAQKTIDELNARGVEKHITVSKQQEEQIRSLTLMLASYKEALNVNKELENFVQKTAIQIKSLEELGAAYGQGAAAIEAANEKAKVAPFQKQVSDLGQVIVKLQQMGATSAALAPLLNAYDQAKQKLDAVTQAVHDEALANEKLDFAKTTEQLSIQIAKLSQYTSAILGGTAAVRQFNIEQQVQAFQRANPLLDTKAIESYRQQLELVDAEQQQNAAAEQVASQLSFKNLAEKIEQLQQLRSLMKDGSDEQIAADAVIRKDQLDYIKGQADLLLSTQSVGNGFKAFFLEFANDGKTAAQDVADTMGQVFKGIEDNLAKFITGQKTSWRKMVTGIGESVAKLGIQTGLQQVTKGIGGLLGINLGGTGKRDGSTSSQALFVQMAGGAAGGAAGALGNIPFTPADFQRANVAASLTAPDGSTQNPLNITTSDSPGTGILAGLGGAAQSGLGAIGGLFGKLAGGAGSGLSSLLGLFTSGLGFLAEGGDATPGRAYMVGEQGPELMVPRSAATVIPNHALGGGKMQHVSVTNHFHGVTDMDTFKKSSSQIQRDFGRSVQVAGSRR